MNIEQKDLQLIEAYIKNDMTAEERRRFEERMEAEAGLSEEVSAYRQIFRGFQQLERDNFRSEVAAFEQTLAPIVLPGLEEETDKKEEKTAKIIPFPSQKRSTKTRSLAMWAAVAASIALLVWIGVNGEQAPDYEQLAMTYHEVPVYSPSKSTNESAYQLGFKDFSQKNYAKAIPFLKKVDSADKNYLNAAYLLGQSYLQEQDFKAAVPIFETLQTVTLEDISLHQSDSDAYISSYDLQWQLALAYLGNQQKENSLKILQNLLADKDKHSYGEKAAAIEAALK